MGYISYHRSYFRSNLRQAEGEKRDQEREYQPLVFFPMFRGKHLSNLGLLKLILLKAFKCYLEYIVEIIPG